MPYETIVNTPLWRDSKKTQKAGRVDAGVVFKVDDSYPKGKLLAETMLHTLAEVLLEDGAFAKGWIEGKNVVAIDDDDVAIQPPLPEFGALVGEYIFRVKIEKVG